MLSETEPMTMSDEHYGDSMRAEESALLDRLAIVLREALATVDDRPAIPKGADDALAVLREPLPESGTGGPQALEQLLELNAAAGANTAGPRCFHFVIGGSTPAALAADLVATAYETLTYTWVVSPIGVRMEMQALDWLKEMFGLPKDWAGVMTTGATMANFVGLMSARQWWGNRIGVNPAKDGMAGLPPMPVISSGYFHASSKKCLSMMGVGWGNVRICARDEVGRVDLDKMRAELDALDGAPAVVVINAGEVNAGDFDPVSEIMDLAREYDTWVHVDGAFGMFARVSPRVAHLVAGAERADSVTVDGHKWLNVPYDVGFSLVRDHELMAEAFRYTADYLPAYDDPRPTPGAISPESSRRGRSFCVWAALKAYGLDGQRELVEHCLDLADELGRIVEAADDLELMAPVQLNITAFRYNPGGMSDEELDALNQELGEAVLADGRFLVGTSRLGPRHIFRPCFSNWRTQPEHVAEFAAVVQELGAGLLADR
jgi:glutamate/tyrosine decarboxylase-like PLP-dependent enzyme